MQTPEEILEEQISAAFEHPDPEPDPEPEPEAPEPEEPAAPEPTEPEAPSPGESDEAVDVYGVRLSRDEAQALLNFRAWIQANPDKLPSLVDYIEGRGKVVSEATAAAPGPTDDDLSELPTWAVERLREVDDLKKQVGTIAASTRDQQLASNRSAIERASTGFAQRYGLDPKVVDDLQQRVINMGIFPQLVATNGGDVQRATEDALEVAYFKDPANRQREIERITKSNQDASARTRKASKIAGSTAPSRSATKAPTEMGRQELLDAIAADIKEATKGITS